MGMNLSQQRSSLTAASSQAWLGSAHATDTADSITVQAASIRGSDFEGVVPSGVVVSERSDGLYELGSGGTGRVGFLLEGLRVPATDDEHVTAALLWHGQVLIDELPDDHGLTEAAADRMTQIDFVGDVPANPE